MVDPSGFQRRRVFIGAATLALLLHVAVLAALTLWSIPADTPAEILRITLVGGGGGGASGDAAPAAAAPAQPPAPPPQAEPAPAPRPAPVAVPVRPRRAPPRQKPALAAASRPEPVAPIAAVPPPSSSDEGSGTGTGTGSGAGTGSGTGPGSGSGSGGGAGSGTGAGRGAGTGNGDLRALCLRCPEPSYPRIARMRGWEGVVDVDVSIAADGAVAGAAVARSSGYAALDDAALDSARRSRFRLDGTAIGVRGRIAYGFRLTGR
jgi:protein TonB